MKLFYLCTFIFCCAAASAQNPDDPEAMLNGMKDSAKSEKVIATFKSTRIVNAQSVETVGGGVLDFRIMHRFGTFNKGWYEFWGLDNASMRLGFEYGITDNFMIGVGRSTTGKTYDGFAKWRILQQTTGGARNMPVSLTLFGSAALKTLHIDPARDAYFPGKLTYSTQLLIGSKINNKISLELMPTYIHRNLVDSLVEKNEVIAIGFGGRYKITRSIAINFDYFYTPKGQLSITYKNPLSIGIDIETGGHVFQLHFTNSTGLIEKQFITETTDTWKNGGILFGFNLSRVFTIRKHK
jgi:opacity protein-like surface antigen